MVAFNALGIEPECQKAIEWKKCLYYRGAGHYESDLSVKSKEKTRIGFACM